MAIEHDIAWLAGILDGEGSVSLVPGSRERGRKAFSPKIEIFNTSEVLLNKVHAVIISLGAKCNDHRANVAKWSFLARKPVYRITITSAKDVLIVCKALQDHLTEKRGTVDFVIQTWGNRVWRSKWTDQECQSVIAFRSRKI